MISFIDIPLFNTVLDDRAREHYRPATNLLFAVVPEMMDRKIAKANVQQSFMIAAILKLLPDLPQRRVLCAGCYEDTAYEALCKMGYPVYGIDPQTDGNDLASFVESNNDLKGNFDLVFATSVIEHVPEDERFAYDAASLVRPGGYVVLTCDFRDSWQPGDALPQADKRFYTSYDLKRRLPEVMKGCKLLDDPDWQKYEPDFLYEGCLYSFATLTVLKS